MKASTFRLIDAINREGLDNSRWGVIEDCESTASVFGAFLDMQLKGQYIYIYRNIEDIYSFIEDTGIEPTEIALLDIHNRIEFYKI